MRQALGSHDLSSLDQDEKDGPHGGPSPRANTAVCIRANAAGYDRANAASVQILHDRAKSAGIWEGGSRAKIAWLLAKVRILRILGRVAEGKELMVYVKSSHT